MKLIKRIDGGSTTEWNDGDLVLLELRDPSTGILHDRGGKVTIDKESGCMDVILYPLTDDSYICPSQNCGNDGEKSYPFPCESCGTTMVKFVIEAVEDFGPGRRRLKMVPGGDPALLNHGDIVELELGHPATGIPLWHRATVVYERGEGIVDFNFAEGDPWTAEDYAALRAMPAPDGPLRDK